MNASNPLPLCAWGIIMERRGSGGMAGGRASWSGGALEAVGSRQLADLLRQLRSGNSGAAAAPSESVAALGSGQRLRSMAQRSHLPCGWPPPSVPGWPRRPAAAPPCLREICTPASAADGKGPAGSHVFVQQPFHGRAQSAPPPGPPPPHLCDCLPERGLCFLQHAVQGHHVLAQPCVSRQAASGTSMKKHGTHAVRAGSPPRQGGTHRARRPRA